MARPLFIVPPLAGLDNQPLNHRSEMNGGLFSTSAKFYAVSIMLWTGLIAMSATLMVGAWSLGAAFTQWMSK